MKSGLCAAAVSAMLCACAAPRGYTTAQQEAIAAALARIEAEAACVQAAARDPACFDDEMAARGYRQTAISAAGQ